MKINSQPSSFVHSESQGTLTERFNMHFFPDSCLMTMALPKDDVVQIAKFLRDLKVKKVISFDLSFDHANFSRVLKHFHIDHVAHSGYEIPDFFTTAQLPVEMILSICHEIDHGEVTAIHCRGGNGRSGVIAACRLLLDRFISLDSDNQTELVNASYYDEQKIEVMSDVAKIIYCIRKENPYALERREDVEKVNEFYLHLRAISNNQN